MGAEVATLSLWLSSFVPGLSLAYLGRNVVVGNSLIGVARPEALRPSSTAPKKGRLGEFHRDDLGAAEPFFQSELDAALGIATAAIAELASIDDRTPEEYEASRAADAVAREATKGLKRIFDLWTAEGFGQVGSRQEVELNGVNVISGDMTEDAEQVVGDAAALGERHSFLHWPLEFPHVFSRAEPGFDVVVGNPPWEEVTVERLAFYGLHQPGLRSLTESERERAIEELLERRPDLAERLEQRQEEAVQERTALAMGEYEPMTGDPDLYKFFCQRYRTLVRPGGLLGVVLPRAAFVNDGSKSFRHWLFEGTTTSRLDFVLNRRNWIFDTHPQYTIALVVAERSEPEPGHQVEVAGTATSLDEWGKQSASEGLRIAEAAFGPGWITPLLRSQAEADLLGRVRTGSSFPFGSSGRWRCFPVRELDETNHSGLWRDATSGRPLWKGESFDQYDPHGAEARWCPTSDAVWEKVCGPSLRPGAGSMLADPIPITDRRRALAREVERARVAFRDVSRATDSRTVRACLIPPEVFLTNTAPYLVFLEGNELAQAVCVGVMNSLPFDWQARRFVEIHLNFFLLEGLVVPDLADDDYREISRASARLSTVDDRFSDFARNTEVDVGPLQEGERERLRVEIDARVARSWKMTSKDLDVMFSDFTLDAVPADYRQAVSARLAELS
ncbi:MAG: hypothetical protein WD942_09825 [Dehalococcoidia bacterium]